MNMPGFTADSSNYRSAGTYVQPMAIPGGTGWAVTPQLAIGGGGVQNSCVDTWQNCYVNCSVKYPESDNNLNSEFQQACMDSCDASFNLCSPTTGGAVRPPSHGGITGLGGITRIGTITRVGTARAL